MTLELKHPKSDVLVSSARAFHDASRPSHCFGLRIPGFILGALCALASVLSAAVPQLLNHQGRIAVNGTNFEGTGQFKFALVNSTGSTTYWSNDGTSTAGSQPTAAVSLPVVKGLYAVLLGDTALANMTTLPTTVFENADVRLRVWFNDGTNGFQHITPDQRLASAPFAMNAAQAESVPDASITSAKLASNLALTGITTGTFSGDLSGNAATATTVADGAITTAKLADGAISTEKIASGSVVGSHITAGAVTEVHLANTSLSGAMLDGQLQFSTPGSVSVSVVFGTPLSSAPYMTQSPGGWAFSAIGATGFTATAPFAPIIADAASTLNSGSSTTLVHTVSGRPAIAYYDGATTTIKYAVASNTDGTGAWTIVTVSPTGANATSFSMAVIGGFPCISYRRGSSFNVLMFARSATPDGTGPWTETNVPGGGQGNQSCLAEVAGRPAISSRDGNTTSLRYAIAENADGSGTWTTATVDTGSGFFSSLCVVNGRPSISYQDTVNSDLKYVRANDAAGTTWGTPVTLDANGVTGLHTSLKVVSGQPAISYYDSTNGDLRYIRATDADGAAWGAPATIDSTGVVGLYTSQLVINDRPAISYYDSTNTNLKFAYAGTADGSGPWSTASLDTAGNVGTNTSLAVSNGAIGISYHDVTNSDLKFARVTGLHWTANTGFTLSYPIIAPSFNGNLDGHATTATNFTAPLAGDVTGTQSATTIADTTITSKAITGFASSPGTLTASDSILNAINKLDGNIALRAPLVSPSFTGTVTGTFSGNGSALTSLNGANISTGTVGSTQITDLSITNTDVSNSAAIAYSKLSLGNSIVNADVNTAAAIAYSKLNLAGAIVNADISSSAAIADAKLATISSAGKVANSATTGTAANSPSTLVLRDASGNFTAGTINGTFVGNGSGLTGVTASSVLLSSVIAPPIRPVVAWGRNNAGQTTVPSTLSNANTAAIAAGGDTSVALLKTGTVVQWGSGTAVPAGLANVTHIAAGTSHRLARRSDGTVVAWGGNAYNQSTVPGGLTTATNIAAGEKHSLALRADGTVLAWGDNTFTQTSVPGTATNVIAIAAGYDHSLALKADGTVVAWGRDDSGQVTGSYPSVGVIVAIIDSTRFRLSTQLASGTSQLRYDGTTLLTSVGDGSDVVTVADTSSLSQGMAVTRPDLVGPSGLTDVIAIACGAYHSLAVKSDGSVVAWGWDGGGQVSGAASLTGISRIAGGYAFTLALKNDGTLVAFGDNTDLQLNVPSSTASITAIACGASHALALRADLIPAQVARLDQDNVFTGNVGIKRSPAANTLEVEGQASKTTAGNWLANSDRRIKDNVKPITGALEKLSKVRLVDFNYTPDYLAAHPGIEHKRYLNVIAQEFAEVFPEDVKTSGETLPDGSPILQVDTYPLTIYSAAAVQELARENERLKKQIAEQEARIQRIEAALLK